MKHLIIIFSFIILTFVSCKKTGQDEANPIDIIISNTTNYSVNVNFFNNSIGENDSFAVTPNSESVIYKTHSGIEFMEFIEDYSYDSANVIFDNEKILYFTKDDTERNILNYLTYDTNGDNQIYEITESDYDSAEILN